MRIAEKKKSQIAALYEQCSGLPADVRSCLENGYFTVTVPPPWNMSNQKVAQEVQDKINGQGSILAWSATVLTASAHFYMCCEQHTMAWKGS